MEEDTPVISLEKDLDFCLHRAAPVVSVTVHRKAYRMSVDKAPSPPHKSETDSTGSLPVAGENLLKNQSYSSVDSDLESCTNIVLGQGHVTLLPSAITPTELPLDPA